MRTTFHAMMLRSASLAATLLAVAGVASAATTVNLTAQRAVATLPDGTAVPMWAYCGTAAAGSAGATTGGACAPAGAPAALPAWSPGPMIVLPTGDALTVTLANSLPVATSLTIVGQIGGSDTGTPNRVSSPVHVPRATTSWPANATSTFTPPLQGLRARSFGLEAAPAGSQTYTWAAGVLRPGTYLYQTGSHPSLQQPMGLYGVLIVTTAPGIDTTTATISAPGLAYPAAGATSTLPPGTNVYGASNAGAPYDADVTFLLSEIDADQNAAVDAAAVALSQEDLPVTDPSCLQAQQGGAVPCYPAAVNYRPTYFLVNGSPYNAANAAATTGFAADLAASGNILVRFVNAGSRLHTPSIPGLQMALLSEDGNLAPGLPKLQSEVNLPPGRTSDVLVNPASNDGVVAGGATTAVLPKTYTDRAYPLFDRALALAGANLPDAGMHGFLAIGPAGTNASAGALNAWMASATGGVASVAASAANYTFSLAPGVLPSFSASVATNSKGLSAIVTGTAPANGTLTWGAGGTFTYVPMAAPIAMADSFTYCNSIAGVATDTCGTVTLAIATEGATITPPAASPSFTSTVSSLYRALTRGAGVLAGYHTSDGYPLNASLVSSTGCNPLVLNVDGSFSASPANRTGGTCSFTFKATDPRNPASATTDTATVAFPAPSNIAVQVVDALNNQNTAGTALTIPDYMWIIQEDRTFHNPNPGATPPFVAGSTPPPSLAVSFHQSHMPVVAVGCTGPMSCGDGAGGQAIQGGAAPVATYSTPADAVLDPTKYYYISVLPGDAANPVINGFSGDPSQVANLSCLTGAADGAAAATNCGHTMGGASIQPAQVAAALSGSGATIKVPVEPNPLKPAALSIYIFEDNSPTNNDYDANEIGLGGFSIIVNDVGGRSGDPVGQITYDAFNMPLTNALLGVTGCPNETASGTAAMQQTNLVGVVYTCPDGNRRITAVTVTRQNIRFTTAMPHHFRESIQGRNPTIDISGFDVVALNGSFAVSGANGNTFTIPNPGIPAGAHVKVYSSSMARDATTYQLAGQALINNIMPGRFDVVAHPGAAREGNGETWYQVSTLEGTPGQDAFTKANEPNYFQEFGPPGFHTFIGWLNPGRIADQNAIALAQATAAGSTATTVISGRVTSLHMSRTVMETLWDSASNASIAQSNCLVAVNQTGETGNDIGFTACNPDGTFTLPPIPAGQQYELVVWDQWLDQIIAFKNLPASQTAAATVALGDIPVFSWFTRVEASMYLDTNGNGVRDPGEPGLAQLPIIIHFRDGSISNQLFTDGNGNAVFNELFPLFNWYVMESDRTRFASTGVNITVDAGGLPDCEDYSAATGQGAINMGGARCPGATVDNTGAPDVSANLGVRTAGVANSSYVWTDPTTHLLYGAVPTGASTSTNRVDAGTTAANGMYEGVQSFINQTQILDFGRRNFKVGETGGIQGMVVYSSTRGFDDPSLQVQNLWEPGVPRVTINLWRKQANADGTVGYVFVNTTTSTSWDDWANLVHGSDGNNYLLGADNVLRSPATGLPAAAGVTAGTQVNMRCPGQDSGDPFLTYSIGQSQQFKCYDGFHMWNQVQPAVFDGAYAFSTDQTGAPLTAGTYVVEMVPPPGYELVKEEDKNILIGDLWVAPVAQQFGGLSNFFILPDQASLSAAYNPANPNNNNTTLGLGFTQANQGFPDCVGTPHQVPDFVSLFPASGQVAPFAGAMKPLCDRKEVILNDQSTGAANFFVFTSTPRAAHFTGLMLDDAAAEINAAAPDFGEKFAAAFAPVSIKDFNGVEMGRVYTDQWGTYNGMVYSTWQVNVPNPSGYSPNMMVNCMNDPGPILDTRRVLADGVTANPTYNTMVRDPLYNPSYSNFCYTNPFMPGLTVYLDTPILPVAAFAAGYNPPDCALPATTPAIARVDGDGKGPWVAAADGSHSITITAQGDVEVPNPNYQGPSGTVAPWNARTITRHYGFGASQVAGYVSVNGVRLGITNWSDQSITATVPAGVTSGELTIVAGNGVHSVDTVTLNVGGAAPVVVEPVASNTVQTGSAHPIQDAIDAARPGDLIIVDAGTYPELVILWKPLRLQGVGAASTIINAAKYPTQKLQAWRPRINQLFAVDTVAGNQIANSQVDPLPNQEITGGIVLLEPSVLATEEGAGITVLAKDPAAAACGSTATSSYPDQVMFPPSSKTVLKVNTTTKMSDSNFTCAPSRIDGLSITGGDSGGGIYVNGWAHGLEISNNRVFGNAGSFNGGVRVGIPYLEGLSATPVAADGTVFGFDVGVSIHHNQITHNGTVEANPGTVSASNATGVGGGVSICSGTDNYRVNYNFICGNYSAGDGGGIGQTGVSNNGVIAENTIIFNQSYQQTAQVNGGGIVIEGEVGTIGGLSLGTGSVTIDRNLIRGNFAQGGHGGGIRLQQVNGSDVTSAPNGDTDDRRARRITGPWYAVTVTNNMIDNNVAGWGGGGISMADALAVTLANNTIANNDSVGIVGSMIGSNPLGRAAPLTNTTGYPSPAGVSVDRTSTALLTGMNAANLAANAYANPLFFNNIVWHNRSFYFAITQQANPLGVTVATNTLCPSNTVADAYTHVCTPLPAQASIGQCTGSPAYWDLGTTDDSSAAAGSNAFAFVLSPSYSVLSDVTGYPDAGTNVASDPQLAKPYCNGARANPAFIFEPGQPFLDPATQNLTAGATLDEAGNFVDVRFGPLYLFDPTTSSTTSQGTLIGDYHLAGPAGAAYNAGATVSQLVGGVPSYFQPTLASDIDGDARPPIRGTGSGVDIGADEIETTGATIGGTPTSLAFGNVQTGQVSTQVFDITNGGSASSALVLGPMAASGFFAPSSNCPAAGLAAGQTCQVTITFAPRGIFAQPTAQAGSILLSSNAVNAIPPIAVGGTAYPPMATASSGAFGPMEAGAQVTRQISVTNTGVGPWYFVGSGTITAGGGTFSVGAGGTCANYDYASPASPSLPVGSACTVNVSFRVPGDGNDASGSLSVSEAAHTLATPSVEQTVSQAVALSVRGVSPQFEFSNATENFGSVAAGRTSPALAVTLRNTSGIPITFNAGDIVLGGANAGQFAISADTCTGSTVANNGTCAISTRFTPNSIGAKTGAMTVSPGGVRVGTVNLRGTGTSPVAFAPATHTFTVANGATSAAVNFTLTNSSSVNFTLGGAAALGTPVSTGGGSGTFAMTASTCTAGAVLAPAGTCTVSLTFHGTNVSTTRTVTDTLNVSGALTGNAVTFSGTSTLLGR